MFTFRLTGFLALSFSLSTAAALIDAETASTSPPAPETIVELDELVVHSQPFGRSVSDLAESATVLTGPRLDARRAPSLGETLDGAPGVSSTYFGPGASRPLIRGLGGERIRILTNGLGSSDVSGTSPDHAVSLDPALINRIEVLRGPAVLLYGSSAVGGLVNVIDKQIPDGRADRVTGFWEGSYGTGANAKSVIAHADGPASASGALAWQLSLQRHRSGDLAIPGFAEAEPDLDDDHEPGVLENSAIDTTSGSAGTSWFWDGGSVGAAISALDSRYGVPGHEHEEAPDAEEPLAPEEHAGVTIDLQQRRFDARAETEAPLAGFRSARWRFGAADYRHLELEGDEIGTRFDSDSWETRLDLLHHAVGPFEGAVGAQLQHTTLAAAGEEAFLPASRTFRRALFALEEIPSGAIRWQLGARWEAQAIKVRDGSGIRHEADALSASAGGLWSIDAAWALAFSVARTERAPTAQELFADGPHAATRTFEIGDATLAPERSTGVDVSLRRTTGVLTGALTVFVNDFDGFITETLTGETIDELPVYRYVAQDARFSGAELETTWHLHQAGLTGWELTFTADTVRATNRTTGEALPRIPAVRAGVALSYEGERWSAGGEVRHTARQGRVAPLETPSPGYTLVSLYCEYNFPLAEGALRLFARASNLTDAEARPHTSFLKGVAPLPGRNLTLGARWEF